MLNIVFICWWGDIWHELTATLPKFNFANTTETPPMGMFCFKI